MEDEQGGDLMNWTVSELNITDISFNEQTSLFSLIEPS